MTFLLKTGHFGCYVMRLWSLCKLFYLISSNATLAGRGGVTSSFLPCKGRSPGSQLGLVDTWRHEGFLVTAGHGWEFQLLLWSQWHHRAWSGLIADGQWWRSWFSTRHPLTPPHGEGEGCPMTAGESLDSWLDFCWYEWGGFKPFGGSRIIIAK